VFRLTDLDLGLQRHFYVPSSGWAWEDLPWFRLIYRFGNLPALLAALGGLYLFIQSFRRARWLAWRRIGLYLVLSLLIGPGLVVNMGLKDNWGRPRPKEVTQFGGRFAYEEILGVDPSSPGKSFPCGHATMGFYFFSVHFLLRRSRKLLAAGMFVFAAGYGTLIGIVRMAGGGHFASDVLWAAGLVWLVCAGLFYLMRLHRDIWHEETGPRPALNWWQRLGLYGLGLVLVLGVVLATPYSRHRSYEFSGARRLKIDLLLGDLVIKPASANGLFLQNGGFGLPGSKLVLRRGADPDSLRFCYAQRKIGWFTELNSRGELDLDSLRMPELDLALRKGSVDFALPSAAPPFRISVGWGEVVLRLPQGFDEPISFAGGGELLSSRPDVSVSRQPSAYSVRVERGRLVIR
jgi:membrane-associated PAP2 superfamily phosphatase